MRDPWIPKGFHTITPNIIVDDAEEAIAFLEAGLGATERYGSRCQMERSHIASSN